MRVPPRPPQSKLALEWRQWMTESLLQQYMQDRTFYQLQSTSTVDNPDQRISADIRCASFRPTRPCTAASGRTCTSHAQAAAPGA